MRLLFVLALTALVALPVLPADAAGGAGMNAPDDLSAAERQILEACLAEPDTDPAACGCYLKALRRLLPERDYALATGLAAAAMRGDGEAFRRLVTRHGLSAARLQEILTATDRALTTAEHRCEGGKEDSSGNR